MSQLQMLWIGVKSGSQRVSEWSRTLSTAGTSLTDESWKFGWFFFQSGTVDLRQRECVWLFIHFPLNEPLWGGNGFDSEELEDARPLIRVDVETTFIQVRIFQSLFLSLNKYIHFSSHGHFLYLTVKGKKKKQCVTVLVSVFKEWTHVTWQK